MFVKIFKKKVLTYDDNNDEDDTTSLDAVSTSTGMDSKANKSNKGDQTDSVKQSNDDKSIDDRCE